MFLFNFKVSVATDSKMFWNAPLFEDPKFLKFQEVHDNKNRNEDPLHIQTLAYDTC